MEKDFEEEFEPTEPFEFFQKELEGYLEEYEEFLLQTLKKATVHKHSYVISYGIEYLCCVEGVEGFEDITFGMVSSKLHSDFESNCQEGMSRKAVLNIMIRFFEFIYDKHGVQNKKLMQRFKTAKV